MYTNIFISHSIRAYWFFYLKLPTTSIRSTFLVLIIINLICLQLLDIQCMQMPITKIQLIFIFIGPTTFMCINCSWIPSSLVNTSDSLMSKNIRHMVFTDSVMRLNPKQKINTIDIISYMVELNIDICRKKIVHTNILWVILFINITIYVVNCM